MSRKDYRLAEELLASIENVREQKIVAEAFKKFFKQDNYRFDSERFSSYYEKRSK